MKKDNSGYNEYNGSPTRWAYGKAIAEPKKEKATMMTSKDWLIYWCNVRLMMSTTPYSRQTKVAKKQAKRMLVIISHILKAYREFRRPEDTELLKTSCMTPKEASND